MRSKISYIAIQLVNMKYKFSLSFIRNTLITLLALVGTSAAVGGFGLVITDGLGMQNSVLKDTPFTSFILPGLILSFIVGGTQLIALYKLLKRKNDALFYAAIASFGLMIWLFVEVFIIDHRTALQAVFYAFAILEMMAILGLLKIYPQIVIDK